MTKDDTTLFQSMEGNFIPPTDNFAYAVTSPVEAVSFQKSHSGSMTISELTDLPQRMSPDIIPLNYSPDNSTMVLETIIGHHGIKVKAVSAIYHFNI